MAPARRPSPCFARPGPPAILIIPAGRCKWVIVDREGFEDARHLCAKGAADFVLRSRFVHQDREAGLLALLQDAQRSLRVIRSSADIEGICPSRTIVMGFSAGGLAADLPDACGRRYGGAFGKRLVPLGGTPEGVVPASLHIFEAGGHGFGLRGNSSTPCNSCPDLVSRWGQDKDLFWSTELQTGRKLPQAELPSRAYKSELSLVESADIPGFRSAKLVYHTLKGEFSKSLACFLQEFAR